MRVYNKRSNTVENNEPKFPIPSSLEYGELCINYADGHEAIAFKNDNNEIVVFGYDKEAIDARDEVVAESLVNLNSGLTNIQQTYVSSAVMSATAQTPSVTNNVLTIPTIAGAQGPQGANGTNGEEGKQGPQGANGTDGKQGPQGPQGADGTNGENGKQGPQGVEGAQGPQGASGTNGEEGKQGPQGAEGMQGPQGPKATTEEVVEALGGKYASAVTLNGTSYTTNNGNINIGSAVTSGTYYSNGNIHEIQLYAGPNVIATINANDFVKDGMVEDAFVSGESIYITFNTDAGSGKTIEVPISDIFDPDNYYTKDDIDARDEVVSGALTDIDGRLDTVESSYVSSAVMSATAQTPSVTNNVLTIPTVAGSQGPQGPQGANGSNGTNGTDGKQGPQGANGSNGTDGKQGPQGPEGPSTIPTIGHGDEGKVLKVVNGVWALVTPINVYSGSGTPPASVGIDGDLYLQTS